MQVAGARVLVTGGARSARRRRSRSASGERGAQVAFTYNHSRDEARDDRERSRGGRRGRPRVRCRPGRRRTPRDRAVEAAAAALGGLDVLVHAASGGFVP